MRFQYSIMSNNLFILPRPGKYASLVLKFIYLALFAGFLYTERSKKMQKNTAFTPNEGSLYRTKKENGYDLERKRRL